MSDEAELICGLRGCAGVITLNRPGVINALNLRMLAGMLAQLRSWAEDSRVSVVVVRGIGERGFCAGGDVRAVYDARGEPLFMDRVYRVEYELDEYISRYPKPYVALMHGITMGGGCGISVHGRHRVVTETTVLAMPEVLLGLFPDVAGTVFLSRCPGTLGLYLALTGTRIDAMDAIALGLADWYVQSDCLDQLVEDLSQGADPASVIRPFLQRQTSSALMERRSMIDEIFSHASVSEILAALEQRTEAWTIEARGKMLAASPTSLEVTFRAMHRARKLSIRDCLIMDFRIAQRMMRKSDYFEGVRSLLIDKERRTRWSPASLNEIDPCSIEEYFAPLPLGYEMTF